jgi:hypothetical protein
MDGSKILNSKVGPTTRTRALVRPSITFARYQKSRIPHFHTMLDAYLAGEY